MRKIVNVNCLYDISASVKMHEGLVRKNTGEKTAIMTVDDYIGSLRVIGRSLERADSKVHTFSDPLIALHHVQNDYKYCQVLVSDIRILALTGFQLVRKVRM
jgi:DNA-binding NtrC family response regulator